MIVGGPRGLRRSTDGGDSFAAVKGAINNSQISDLDAAKGAVFADGIQDVYRSTDKGKTWTVVRKPGTYKKNRNGKKVNTKPVQDIDFVTGKTGYFLDRNGFLYRTADGGSKWSTLSGVATNRGYAIAFSDSSKGYVVIDRFGSQPGSGYLLRTSDAGKTWAPEFVVASRIANAGVAAGTGGTDYLLGGTSSLLFTTTGGLAGTPSTLSIKTKQTKYKSPPKGSITVTGTLKPTLRTHRSGDGQLAGPGVDPVALADRAGELERLVHHELAPGQGDDDVRRPVVRQLPERRPRHHAADGEGREVALRRDVERGLQHGARARGAADRHGQPAPR